MDSVPAFISRVVGWLGYRRARALARNVARARLKSIPASRLLVLCYGNIYRSPFVEYYLKAQCPQDMDLEVRSAGFHDRVGRHSADDYVEHCKQWGVDLSSHRSSKVTSELLQWADLVIIMDGHNYKMIKQFGNEALCKLLWLGAVAENTPVEIADPYGTTPEQQARVVKQLADASTALLSQIR